MNKAQNRIFLGLAIAALVAIFCYQVAYGKDGSSEYILGPFKGWNQTSSWIKLAPALMQHDANDQRIEYNILNGSTWNIVNSTDGTTATISFDIAPPGWLLTAVVFVAMRVRRIVYDCIHCSKVQCCYCTRGQYCCYNQASKLNFLHPVFYTTYFYLNIENAIFILKNIYLINLMPFVSCIGFLQIFLYSVSPGLTFTILETNSHAHSIQSILLARISILRPIFPIHEIRID